MSVIEVLVRFFLLAGKKLGCVDDIHLVESRVSLCYGTQLKSQAPALHTAPAITRPFPLNHMCARLFQPQD